MGGNERISRSNLTRVKIDGRSNPTIKGQRNIIVLIPRNVPIRHTVEELRKIRGDVESTAKHKILGAETCYRIRKLRLNKQSKKIEKLNRKELREERGVLKTNLIEIKTMKSLGQDYTNRKFTLILSNVQSIKNKQDTIIEPLEDSNADLAVLTETWLTDADEVWVQESKFQRHNYKMDECHRKGRKGGGLALIAKHNLKLKREEHRITAELEYVKWKVTSSNSFLNILGIYRPPDSSIPQFLDIFTELLVDIVTSNTNLVVLGNFNIHVNKIDDPHAGIFLDTMTALGMRQHVRGPTHRSRNCLDLIFTEEMSKTKAIECSHSMFVSDHSSIQCILNIAKERCTRKEVTYRKLKDVDLS